MRRLGVRRDRSGGGRRGRGAKGEERGRGSEGEGANESGWRRWPLPDSNREVSFETEDFKSPAFAISPRGRALTYTRARVLERPMPSKAWSNAERSAHERRRLLAPPQAVPRAADLGI